MIQFKTDKTVIKIDFSFFAVITLFLCLDATGYGMMSIAACFFHECGHLIIMSLKGASPETVTFYGGGIKIGGGDYDVSVIAAGSALNFLIAGGAALFSDGTSIYPPLFAVVNLIIGMFNLLPLGYLDGKRLIECILIKRLSPEKAVIAMHKIEMVVLAAAFFFVILLFFFRQINFTIAIMLAYLTLLDILSK